MQFYPHRTVEEQASRLPYELREAYRNSQIDRIKISDGNVSIDVTGYAEYSYLEEKSYKTQPVRSQNGVIEEIDEYATFITPRLIIKYNMMGIEDYRRLMLLLQRKNSFMVTCYDVVKDVIVRNEMYVAPPSMPIIYQQYLMALGIQEYSIELISTNTYSLDLSAFIPITTDDGGVVITNQYLAKTTDFWYDLAERESTFSVDSESDEVFMKIGESSVWLADRTSKKKVHGSDLVRNRKANYFASTNNGAYNEYE